MELITDIVKTAQVEDRLYILDTVPYEIQVSQDVTTIYVPQDSFNSYKELNPNMNIKPYNYKTIKVTKPEFYKKVAAIVTTESNPELMELLYSKGLCANENYMTLEEAERCTNESVDLLLRSNTTVKSFDEFKYFTNVTEIFERFAQGATQLKTVTLPPTVKRIGKLAFGFSNSDEGESQLETVNGAENVEYVGIGCFQMAYNFRKINFTQKLKKIDNGGFNKCSALESVGDVSGVEEMNSGNEFFGCFNLRALNFSNKLSGALTSTFYDCRKLETVGDMSNITSISNAFNRCHKLKKLNLSNKCTSIGSYAFFYCESLTNVGDLSGVTTLGDSKYLVFGYNFALQQDLYFPKVTTINKILFRLNGETGGKFYMNTWKLSFDKTYDEMTKKGKIVSNQSGKASEVNLKIYFNGVEATPEQYATLI